MFRVANLRSLPAPSRSASCTYETGLNRYLGLSTDIIFVGVFKRMSSMAKKSCLDALNVNGYALSVQGSESFNDFIASTPAMKFLSYTKKVC